MSNNAHEWICGTREQRPTGVETRGLADEKRLWQAGQELLVGFIGGSKALQDRVFKSACHWVEPSGGGANLAFKQVNQDSDAHIRISFAPDEGSWSNIGKDALTVPKNEATMNLGWVAEDTPEKDFRSVVLHEFGHALGLLHEHNHPELDLHWKKDVVYADLGSPPNNWSRDDVDFNVFEQYPKNRVVMSSNPDLRSIMIYTIPARWLDGQPAITPSSTLSMGDKTFIRSVYRY